MTVRFGGTIRMGQAIRRWAWWTNELGGLLVVVVALVILAWIWDWNWFRPMVEGQASTALGRTVRIGAFDVRGWRHPTVVLEQIRIDNPKGFPRDSGFGRIERLEVTFDPRALLDRELSLTRVHLERPEFALYGPSDAPPNWVFPASPEPEEPEEPPPLALRIGRLSIAGGQVRFEAPPLKSDFRAIIETLPGADPEAPELHVRASGRYSGQPLYASFVGGALLSLRDAARPYPVLLTVSNGGTHLRLHGTLLDPIRLAGADLDLRFEGPDLAALYPLTGVPLPPTAPYRIAGRFDFHQDERGPQFRFRNFKGTVGKSDLSGDLAVRTGGPRLKIEGDLRSKQVLFADLGGFVGAAPGEADVAGQSAAQKRERAEEQASPRLLPDKPVNLPKIRAADFDVRYAAGHIQTQDTPFDDLSVHLRIDDGVLSLRPLRFGIGGGAIAANVLLDGTQDRAHVKADADFRQVDFSKVMGALEYRGSGKVDGRASLEARGNTVAQMLGGGNGRLRLSMEGGDVSALLINLAGLDFGNALLSALGIPSRAKLRCMIADLDMKKGLVQTDTLLLDTTEANVVGDGTVNLADERIDYRVRTQPKTFNIGSISAPIHIGGTLKQPRVRPDAGSLGLRGGAAVALGIVATPLAALLATIQPGTGKDQDCAAMLRAVRREAAQLPRVPDPAPANTPAPPAAAPPLRPATPAAR
jgi:AsmA family protein